MSTSTTRPDDDDLVVRHADAVAEGRRRRASDAAPDRYRSTRPAASPAGPRRSACRHSRAVARRPVAGIAVARRARAKPRHAPPTSPRRHRHRAVRPRRAAASPRRACASAPKTSITFGPDAATCRHQVSAPEAASSTQTLSGPSDTIGTAPPASPPERQHRRHRHPGQVLHDPSFPTPLGRGAQLAARRCTADAASRPLPPRRSAEPRPCASTIGRAPMPIAAHPARPAGRSGRVGQIGGRIRRLASHPPAPRMIAPSRSRRPDGSRARRHALADRLERPIARRSDRRTVAPPRDQLTRRRPSPRALTPRSPPSPPPRGTARSPPSPPSPG